MRHVIVVCLLIFGWIIVIEAQQSAMFEHSVYFEDGNGNRDTVVIGGDTTAALGLNPEFGEIPLNTPFDSVFEVRTISEMEWWKSNPTFTKKYIGWTENVFGFPEPCENIEFVRFVIHIKYLPLKVSWDSKLYKDSLCILSSYLTSSANAINIGPWTLSLNPEDENLAYCVAQQDSVILDIGQGLYTGNLYNEFIYDIEGGITDTMLILEWDFDYAGSSLVCGEIVSTEDIQRLYSPYHAYPNPSNDNITLAWEDDKSKIKDIKVYTANGQLLRNVLFEQTGPKEIAINLDDWISGIYFVMIVGDKMYFTQKIIKY